MSCLHNQTVYVFLTSYLFFNFQRSFERVIPYDWSKYTHLMMRIRGDGRNYLLNIHPDRIFDTNWLDVYQYPLYTRGGPYWQFVKVSKHFGKH